MKQVLIKVLSIHIKLSDIKTIMNVLSNHLVTVFFLWKILLFIPKKLFFYSLSFLTVGVEMLVFDFYS